ncbi:MAG TPA: ABC transporter permease [Thermoanaerobaculia bacterium]|nr:ABC transporter permease [Thermoanaerobaculia bacterium]
MYLRLLAESLRRGTRRKLLAISAVALGTLGATALSEVVLASGDRLASEMSSYGANVEVVPAAGRETLPVAGLAKIRTIFWKNNIAALAPLYPLRVRFSPGEVVAPLVGTWFDHPLEPGYRTGLPATRPTLRVTGRWPHEGAAEAVVGERLARRLWIAPGGTLAASLGGRAASFQVVGLLTSGGEEDDEAFVPLAAVGELAGQPGRFTRVEVFALTNPETQNVRDPKKMSAKEYDAWYCTAYPSSVAFQIHEVLPEADARIVYGVTGATADVLGRLTGVLLALAVVALAGAAVGVTAAMTATVLERRLEAGLLVAIGAARHRVVLFFLSEAALLGLLGGAVGGLAGLAAGRLLGSQVLGLAVPWMPILLPFAALLGLAVATLASLAPVLRALGRYPAAILKRATA